MTATNSFIISEHIIIKQISAQDTYAVRHPILRKNRPLKDCHFNGDSLQSTFHLGLIIKTKLVGVATFMKRKNNTFTKNNQYQLRGMALLLNYQRQGLGVLLLKQAEILLKQKQAEVIWFNAREQAITFYKKNNYTIHGNAFEIPLIGTHYVMYKLL